MRKEPLANGELYHIFTKSIAGFKIFNREDDIERILDLFVYYKNSQPKLSFSRSCRGVINESLSDDTTPIVQIVAYCIMPTHLHLVLKQLCDEGISVFMSNVLNAYSRYFNLKYKRKGPLWEGRFKNKLVSTDEQFLHLVRYIHLNPVTASLVEAPERWHYSSHNEYISNDSSRRKIASHENLWDMDSEVYKKFIKDRIPYQKTLAAIKDLIIEDLPSLSTS